MRKRHLFLAGACLLLTLLPILNLTRILATTGVDSVSNDYLMFVQLADRFLSGQPAWNLYFQDTLYTHVHSYAFLFPVRLLLLRLSHLNVYAEIYAGLLLAIARLLLFYHLLTVFLPNPANQPWYRRRHLWLLPGLSALVFANAQISTFSYGETSLQFGLTQLLILLGLLLLLRWPLSVRGAWLAALCGVLAAYSGGSGLAAWPVFLLAIVWRQPRRPAAYTAWLAGLLIAAWPYLTYSAYGSLRSFQNPRVDLLLIGLGLPFSNNINYGLQTHPQALAAGLLGLFLAAITMGLLWKLKPSVFALSAVPALLLMAWGLFYAVQVMLSRHMIAPWYTTSYSLFWLGLLGLLPLLLDRLPVRPWLGWGSAVLPGWGLAMLGLIVGLYGRTNLTYTDKSFYLDSRSPASAACLRSYQSAPTYCEAFVFQWGLRNPPVLAQLGRLLDKHQWSVLAPEQEWTLQGDFVLGTVQWAPYRQVGLGGWVSGDQDQPARWSDYHHLNALLPAGQTIHWQLNLPAGLHAARFLTAFSRQAGAACAPGSADSAFSVRLEDERGVSHVLKAPTALCQAGEWQAVESDLSAYAGQQVTLILATQGAAGTPAARLRFPRVRLFGVSPNDDWQAQARPANTDLGQALVTESAYRLPVTASQGWQLEQFRPAENLRRFVKSANTATASYALTDQDVCLSDWSQFYLQIGLPDSFKRKMVQVGFRYRPATGAPGQAAFDLPLLPGEGLHTYTLNLDLLDVPPSACIMGVDLLFIYNAPPDASYWVDLKEAGFLARIAPNQGNPSD